MSTKNYQNRRWFDKVIAKIMVPFFTHTKLAPKIDNIELPAYAQTRFSFTLQRMKSCHHHHHQHHYHHHHQSF